MPTIHVFQYSSTRNPFSASRPSDCQHQSQPLPLPAPVTAPSVPAISTQYQPPHQYQPHSLSSPQYQSIPLTPPPHLSTPTRSTPTPPPLSTDHTHSGPIANSPPSISPHPLSIGPTQLAALTLTPTQQHPLTLTPTQHQSYSAAVPLSTSPTYHQ